MDMRYRWLTDRVRLKHGMCIVTQDVKILYIITRDIIQLNITKTYKD
jgi:hypothetical protein